MEKEEAKKVVTFIFIVISALAIAFILFDKEKKKVQTAFDINDPRLDAHMTIPSIYKKEFHFDYNLTLKKSFKIVFININKGEILVIVDEYQLAIVNSMAFLETVVGKEDPVELNEASKQIFSYFFYTMFYKMAPMSIFYKKQAFCINGKIFKDNDGTCLTLLTLGLKEHKIINSLQ